MRTGNQNTFTCSSGTICTCNTANTCITASVLGMRLAIHTVVIQELYIPPLQLGQLCSIHTLHS